jgi:hypothetical protein
MNHHRASSDTVSHALPSIFWTASQHPRAEERIVVNLYDCFLPNTETIVRTMDTRKVTRRDSIPPELVDPEDCTVGEADGGFFEPEPLIQPEPLGDLPEGLIDRIIGLPKEIRNIIAGGIAGMTAKSVVAPLDRIKILYQISSAKFRFFDLPNVAGKKKVNEKTAQLTFYSVANF